MRPRTALVVSLILLAGCTSDDAGDSAADAGHGDHAMQHVMHDLSFAAGNTSAEQTLTGTFQLTDDPQAAPITAAAGVGGPVQFHDISDLVPLGVPVMVSASVASEGGKVLVFATAADPGDIWTTSCTGCAATDLEAAVSRTDTLQLGAVYTGSAPADASSHADGIDYEITVTVRGSAETIMSGMIFEVDLPTVGTHFMLEGINGPAPETLMFGPDDGFLGTIDSADIVETRLRDANLTGKYVFLPKGHGHAMHLRVGTDGSTPGVRVLDQVVDARGPFQPASGTATTYTESTAYQPLQVIACLGGNSASIDPSLTVSGPSGDILSLSSPGPNIGATGGCASTDMGDATLLAGDYEVTYQDNQGDGANLQLFFITYGR